MTTTSTAVPWLLAANLMAGATSAWCMDAVQAPVPSAIGDGQLTIADRTLTLPDGQWQLVARGEGHITTQGINARSTHYTVYAMDAPKGQFRGGVALRLPVASTPVTAWRDDPCKGNEQALLRDDFGNDPKLPQCLLVHKRRTHLSSAADGFYAQAKDWAAANGVALKGAFYEIAYFRYGTNDFGWVRAFLPASAFAGDDQAIAWARGLPGALQRFFEKRDVQADLPPFPRKDA